MRTIFTLLPNGLSVRNFFSTGVLDRLAAQSHVRLVAFIQYPETFANHKGTNSRIIFKRFPKPSRYALSKLIHRALRVRFEMIHENQALRNLERSLRLRQPWEAILDRCLRQPFPRSKRLYRSLRALGEGCNGISREILSLFEQDQPSLVMATNPTRMTEYMFLKQARRMGIPTVGVIKSWDTILTKGYLPVLTDYYLVWTPVMKRDLKRLYDVPDERVGITGIPQFDIYAKLTDDSRRSEFLLRYGLDPLKKTILFSTSAPLVTHSPEPAILDQLAQALSTGPRRDIQILVRLHPSDEITRYQSFRHPNIAYQIPGSTGESRIDARYLDPDFLPLLRDSLAYSDLIINTASTMTLDAAALDKPVINLAIDPEPIPYARSARRFYDFDHYRPVVESGAVKIARTMEELIALVHRYLDFPHLERKERARLCETMCYKLDGHSSQRVANYLLCILDGKPFPVSGT